MVARNFFLMQIPQQTGNGAFSLADGIDFKPIEEGQNATSVISKLHLASKILDDSNVTYLLCVGTRLR